jgi:hypothetical protein
LKAENGGVRVPFRKNIWGNLGHCKLLENAIRDEETFLGRKNKLNVWNINSRGRSFGAWIRGGF